MIGTGKNVGDLRRSNISLLLKLLYFEGAQSRKMLAAKSSLTPAAVTTLTNELMEKGYIVDSEITVKNTRAGRVEQYIDLNYRGLFLLGLRMDRQGTDIRLYNLGLECIGHTQVEQGDGQDVEALFEMLCDKIAFLMVKCGIDTKNLLGIGVTISGIVDPVGGISLNSFGIIPQNVNIRQQIEKRLLFPVGVNNNVRSMLMAESAINHQNQEISHLFIKYGPGLGAAFSIGQQPYNGVHYRALELGHVVADPEGEECRCGRRGCLETLIAFKTIFGEAQALRNPDTTPVLYRWQDKALSLSALSAAVAGGDEPVVELMRSKFSLFARSLESYATILDPQTVSVCSEVFQFEPLHELFLACVNHHAPSLEDRIVLNADSEKTEQVGAASLVIHHFLSGEGF